MSKELVLTPEQLELNRKRALFGMQYLDTDPDKENPELAASLTTAIEQHAAANPPAEPLEKPDLELVIKETDEQADQAKIDADTKAKEEADAAAKEKADKEEAALKFEQDKKDKEEPKEEEEPEPAATALTSDIDIEQVVERAAARAVELSQKKEPVQPKVEIALPEEYKEDLEVLRLIESKNPAMAGTSARALDFWNKEAGYITAWEVAHPGQEFDPEADEHSAFYSKMPEVAPELMERTRKELLKTKWKEEVKEELKQEQAPARAEQEFRRKYDEVAPVALSKGNKAVVEMIAQADPEMAKFLQVDGKSVITQATIDAMADADPMGFEVVNENAEKLRILRSELHKLIHLPGYKPNKAAAVELVAMEGETFYPHAELQRYAAALENEFAKMDAVDTNKGNRRFVRQADLNQKIDKITKSEMPPDQQKAALRDLEGRFWALGEEEISTALVAKYTDQSKRRLAKFKGNSDRKSANGDTTAADKAQKEAEAIKKQKDDAAAKAAAEAAKLAPSRRAPSTTTASDKIDTGGKSTGPTGLTKEQVLKSMWG